MTGGSYGRKAAELEHGGSNSRGWNWYLAGNLFFEDGWRDASPSNVRQFFGKLGRQKEKTSVTLTFAYANNSLQGNALQIRDFWHATTRACIPSPTSLRTVRHS